MNAAAPILIGVVSLCYQSYVGLMVAVLIYMFSGRPTRRGEDDEESL